MKLLRGIQAFDFTLTEMHVHWMCGSDEQMSRNLAQAKRNLFDQFDFAKKSQGIQLKLKEKGGQPKAGRFARRISEDLTTDSGSVVITTEIVIST